VRRLVVSFLAFLAWTAPAYAGGPYMMIGAAEDVGKTPDYAFAKATMDQAKLAGFSSIRITQTWTKDQTKLGPYDQVILGNAIAAAQFTGVRVVLSLYPLGSSVTPLTDDQRANFAAFTVDVAKRYPFVHDFIVGNEPNLNRFWLPQFNADGTDAAAPAYEQLLAATYDALKAVRPHSTVYGGALAPRGVDKPNTGRDTHSPTAFITDLGAAYRASGRQVPIMDAFAFHPYPETSTTGPAFAHPNGTAIGLADYGKLVSLLGTAFDGTAQHGSSLPILYDEFGIETQIPQTKALLYVGVEPATTKPVTEAVQAQYYLQAMQMAFCQPTVLGLLLFHVQDEPALPAWQSGEFYVDGTPKASLYPVRVAALSVRRGIVASCPGLLLTPKLKLVAGKSTSTGARVKLTCSLDCVYSVRLDSGKRLTGTAVANLPTLLRFPGTLAKGRHSLAGSATAALNAGPPGSAALTFRL
jgi:hypothetical protein